jgi:uncharacterized protein (TIGR00369 family)
MLIHAESSCYISVWEGQTYKPCCIGDGFYFAFFLRKLLWYNFLGTKREGEFMAYTNEEWMPYIKEHFSNIPVFRFMGVDVEHVEYGKAVLRLPIREEFSNTWHNIHGGCLAMFADMGMGVALRTLQYKIVTVECKVNFIAPAKLGDVLLAYGKLVHMGKKILLGEVEIVNQDNRLIARGNGTFMILSTAVMEK